MYIIIFAFKHRYRRLSLNNLIFLKKIDNILILNFSGPIIYFLALIFYKIFRFRFILFISCDGNPFLKDEIRSVNLWLGGTNFKIPEKYSKFLNNKVAASTIFTNRKLLFQTFPIDVNYSKIRDNFKFIFISNLKKNNVDDDINIFWLKNKKIILKKISLIDDLNFWKSNFKNFDVRSNFEKQQKYVQLKSLLRINLITNFYKKYRSNFIIIGSDWKKYIPSALPDNYNFKEIIDYYSGNICIDLGAQDGDEIFYPRSIQIVENGGYLFQSRQRIFDKKISNIYKKISFNSIDEMFKKADSIVEDPIGANIFCLSFYKFIESHYSNYKNLKNLFYK